MGARAASSRVRSGLVPRRPESPRSWLCSRRCSESVSPRRPLSRSPMAPSCGSSPSRGASPSRRPRPGGAFTFSNVLPGQYTLEVFGFPVLTGDTSFVVGAGDLARIDGIAVQDDVTLAVEITTPQTTADNVLRNDVQVGHLINPAQAAGVPEDQVARSPASGHGVGPDRAHPRSLTEPDRARPPAEPGRQRHVARLAREGQEEGKGLTFGVAPGIGSRRCRACATPPELRARGVSA